MKKVIVVLIGIIRKKNKYLLTKRVHEEKQYHGKWQLPGGSLEFGETAEECVRRELLEELGVNVQIVNLLPKIFSRTDGKVHYIFISYICQLVYADATVKLNPEASEYGWFDYKKIKKLDQIPQLTEIVEEAERST